MDKYKQGTKFKLREEDKIEYVILQNYEKDNNIYLLAVEIDEGEEKILMDLNQLIMLKVDKQTDELSIETDKEIVREVLEKTMGNN